MLLLRDIVTPDDIERVRQITSSTGFFSAAEIDVAVELVVERLARGPESGYHFLFADGDAGAVGYTCYGPVPATIGSFDLYWIAVDERQRRRGIGVKLMAETEARIAASGGRRVYIETSSRAQYEPTRAFYARCGYVEAALLPDFYAPGDGKVIWVKALPRPA